jgi:hypothetical protein
MLYTTNYGTTEVVRCNLQHCFKREQSKDTKVQKYTKGQKKKLRDNNMKKLFLVKF